MRATLNRARRAHQGDAGFTLIELLIVIVILGILAAIVVFSVRGITDKGDVAACKTSVETIDTAFEAKVAQAPGTLPTATGTTVVSLYPDFIHNDPTDNKIGSVTVDDTTTVDEVDHATCN